MPIISCARCDKKVVKLVARKGAICPQCKEEYYGESRIKKTLLKRLGKTLRREFGIILELASKKYAKERKRSYDGWMYFVDKEGGRTSYKWRFVVKDYRYTGETTGTGKDAQVMVKYDISKKKVEKLVFISMCQRLRGKKSNFGSWKGDIDEGAMLAREKCECRVCVLCREVNEELGERGLLLPM